MRPFLSLILCCLATSAAFGQEVSSMWMYVGSYSGKKSQGIYVMRVDSATGKISPPTLAIKADKASFLAIHPNGKTLYAVNEVSDSHGMRSGGVCAYAIDRSTGKLTELNHQSSGGKGPCFVGLDAEGTCALVANYGSGSVSAIRIAPGGKLLDPCPQGFVQHEGKSVDPKRQEGPHAHSFIVDPSNQFALASDLGIDCVMIYHLDRNAGTLSAAGSGTATPGAGPRHMAWSKDGKMLYVVMEMANTVEAFTWDPSSAKLERVQAISTLPEGFTGKSHAAEIAMHPTGKWIYASNRGDNSVVWFAVDPQSGKLSWKGRASSGGKTPRNFGIAPGGNWLVCANQESDNIVAFKINPDTGALTATGETASIGAPTCVRFLAD